jgi:[acyl-carrier-protein] S-malonyltransferase
MTEVKSNKKKMTNAFIFPGQGSQRVGMLSDWIESRHGISSLLEKANDILGVDIKSIMFSGPKELLTETRYTQAALYLHSAIVSDYVKESGAEAIAVAGHSVGEYAALYSAGVIDFWAGLELVKLRGELMFRAGETKPGTMFAVIGLEDEKVNILCQELNDSESGNIVVAANYNSPAQVVISGSRDYLREVALQFKEEGARMVKELQVSGAFHSPLMEDAKEKLAEKINSTKFESANVPVFTNVEAEAETDAEKLKELLISQLTSPVRWSETMQNMHRFGIRKFTEIGAGKVLGGLVKRSLSDVEIKSVDKYTDLENLA